MTRWERRSAALAFGSALSVVLAEALLRSSFLPWPLALANYMASCYEADSPRAILYTDPRLRLRIERPTWDAACGFNRRTWRHHSDRLGARGEGDSDRADVVLLGDSMVYGQGVEETDTAAHALAGVLGKRVANLGTSGGSPVEYVWQAMNLVPEMRPKVAVVFLYRNDFGEILDERSAAELRTFVESGAGPEANVIPATHRFEGAPARGSWLARAASSSFVFRAVRFCWLTRNGALRAPNRRRHAVDLGLGTQYVHASMKRIRDFLAESGAKLVVAYMPADAVPNSGGERMGRRMRRVSAEVAMELGVPYFDPTGSVTLADGRPDPAAFLAGDWHLSPEGNLRIARALADFITRERLFE